MLVSVLKSRKFPRFCCVLDLFLWVVFVRLFTGVFLTFSSLSVDLCSWSECITVCSTFFSSISDADECVSEVVDFFTVVDVGLLFVLTIWFFFVGTDFCWCCCLRFVISLFNNDFLVAFVSLVVGFFSVSLSLWIILVRLDFNDLLADLSLDPVVVVVVVDVTAVGFTDFVSTRSIVNCGTFVFTGVTGVVGLVGLVTLGTGFAVSFTVDFDTADGFLGILSNVGFFGLFVSLDTVDFDTGERHVDFLSSDWRSSTSFVNTLVSCWLTDFFFSAGNVGVDGGVRFVVESTDVERLVVVDVVVICGVERVSFDANGDT